MNYMDAVKKAIRRLPDSVAVDLFKSETEYLVVVDLPGVGPDDASIRTIDGTLSITPTRPKSIPNEADVVEENRPTELDFDIPLPDDVLLEESQASLSNGVLVVTIQRGQAGTQIPIETE